MPKRFFCVSEQAAVVPIPSLNSAEAFDSGVLLGHKAAERLIDHTRQCYAAARRVESIDEIQTSALSRGWCAAAELPDGTSEDFPLPGKMTAASTLLNHVIDRVDQHWPDTQPTLVQLTTRWPAYALPAGSRLRATLLEAAHAFGADLQPKIAGPSNIGNYLAGLGIPATDERIRLDTIPTIQAVYHATLALPARPVNGYHVERRA